jgi:catechol 2,3-dioxygenase-like lactoylglutathione lyase family enzyme
VGRPRFRSISAVTLATRDMARAVRFYRALGFDVASRRGDSGLVPGGGAARFATVPLQGSLLVRAAA